MTSQNYECWEMQVFLRGGGYIYYPNYTKLTSIFSTDVGLYTVILVSFCTKLKVTPYHKANKIKWTLDRGQIELLHIKKALCDIRLMYTHDQFIDLSCPGDHQTHNWSWFQAICLESSTNCLKQYLFTVPLSSRWRKFTDK